MPAYVNIKDFIKVGIIAFVFIFGMNYALTKAGLEQFKA
jgi:hypothetical protein